VSAYDGDVLVGGIGALVLRDEAAGAHDVEGGDAEEALGVVDAGGFEDFGADGDGGVDGVGDDEDVGVGGGGGDGFGEVADYGGVGVEEVWGFLLGSVVMGGLKGEVTVTGHAGFSGHAGWDEDDF